MRKWRDLSQEEMDQCWDILLERMEEEVLTRTRSWTAKERLTESEATRWNEGLFAEARSKKYRIKKWSEDCWARVFSLFRECNLQRLQSKQDESTEGEMKQQQRMKIMQDVTKK